MLTFQYTITKTAVNAYQYAYSVVDSNGDTYQQVESTVTTKVDADGTKTVQTSNAAPTSVVTMPLTASQIELARNSNYNYSTNSGKVETFKGIPINLDVSNLAVGGTCYEIEPDEELLAGTGGDG